MFYFFSRLWIDLFLRDIVESCNQVNNLSGKHMSRSRSHITGKQTNPRLHIADPIKYLSTALKIDRIVRKRQSLNPIRRWRELSPREPL